MYKNYKVVVVTPAGRKKYLDIFKNFIYRKMEEGLIDGWQLWQNTVNQEDIDYLATMESENPKVKRYFIDNIVPTYKTCDPMRSCEFFQNCHDDETIYIRFDDDIVWCEEGAIEKILDARIDNPDALLIYPNIINSTTISSWHQESGVLSEEAGRCNRESDEDPNSAYLHEFTYADSGLIDLIHETFKKNNEEGTLDKYYLPSKSLDKYQRFSICSICFWGKDHLNVGTLEEEWLAWSEPAAQQRPVWFCGDALMVHYSYHTQRDYLESQGDKHLEYYKNLKENQ